MGTCLFKEKSKGKRFKQDLEKKLVSIYPPPGNQVIKTASRKPTKLAPQSFQEVSLSAKPVQGTKEVNVNAIDGRVQVPTTSKWPYSVHGLLAMKFQGAMRYGTGIMIGPNIVLTAGHNLYNFESKTYAHLKSMQFLPGVNGQVLPFGQVEVEQYFVSPHYIREGKEDYGILILKKPIGEVTGYFGLVCLEPEEIKQKRINVTGYPGDKVASKPNTYQMWGMEGAASHIEQDQGLINYMINTGAGQSGSGVWYREGEDYYVIGVHVLGTYFVNKATLLTRAMYQQIHMWIEHVGFKDLLGQLEGPKILELSNQEIDAKCLFILIKYNLDNLEILYLSGNKIGDEAAKILAQSTSWINLSQLNLWSNNIGAEGAKALAQNTSWINLSHLNLWSNNIGAEGAKALAQNTSWINLSKLYLFGNNIGDEGAKALAQNTSWTKLSKLYLSYNSIGAEGCELLKQNNTWPSLHVIQ